MGKITLVRHGQASLIGDDYDVLSDLGAEQSRLLGDWFAHHGERFHLMVTGGLKRHDATADWCLSRLPAEARPARRLPPERGFEENDHHEVVRAYLPEIDSPAALREYLMKSDDTPHRAFQKMFARACERWMSGKHDADYRETWSMIRGRTLEALTKVAAQTGSGENVVIFTSAGPIAAICQHLLGFPDSRLLEFLFTMYNSSVTRLVCQRERIGFSSYNSIAHLEFARRPDAITYR